MADNDRVTMVAFAELADPHTGEPVAEGEEFETTEREAKFYRKANWAGPPGTDPRDIQLEIAAEAFEERKEARRNAAASRQTFRNLNLSGAQRGHSSAVDVFPQRVLVPEGERPTTNEQLPAATEEGEEPLVPQTHAEDAGSEAGSETQKSGKKKNGV